MITNTIDFLKNAGWINMTAYVLSLFFIALCIHVLIKKARKYLFLKKMQGRQKEYAREKTNLRKKGFKPFKFENGKVEIWAKNFKDATAQYQTDRKNGK